MKDIYRILAGAMGEERRLTQISHNLANVNSVGFKKDGAVFVDYLRQKVADQQATQGAPAAGETAAATEADPAKLADLNPAATAWPTLHRSYIDFSAGPIQQTGRTFDVAIEGEGFFQVQAAGEAGPLYTRAGNFSMDRDGNLLTADGKPVLDAGGTAIKLDPRATKYEINQEGEIRVDNAVAATLGVVKFANPDVLTKHGEGLLKAPQGSSPEAIEKPTLRPRALEGSNVNAIDEMVRMIQTERAYQSMQKAAQAIDEMTARRIEAASQ